MKHACGNLYCRSLIPIGRYACEPCLAALPADIRTNMTDAWAGKRRAEFHHYAVSARVIWRAKADVAQHLEPGS